MFKIPGLTRSQAVDIMASNPEAPFRMKREDAMNGLFCWVWYKGKLWACNEYDQLSTPRPVAYAEALTSSDWFVFIYDSDFKNYVGGL